MIIRVDKWRVIEHTARNPAAHLTAIAPDLAYEASRVVGELLPVILDRLFPTSIPTSAQWGEGVEGNCTFAKVRPGITYLEFLQRMHDEVLTVEIVSPDDPSKTTLRSLLSIPELEILYWEIMNPEKIVDAEF